jgi:hypothetical protein
MCKILTFDEALKKCKGQKNLLIGNGFSIAFDNNFKYTSLYDIAKKRNPDIFSKEVKDIFKSHKADFEKVIEEMKDKNFSEDTIKSVRNSLIKTIADIHIKSPKKITKKQHNSCGQFLKIYNNIYTINYDLLVDWVLDKECDNFYEPTSDIKIGGRKHNYLWKGSAAVNNRDKIDVLTVYYLHGSLMFFHNEFGNLKKEILADYKLTGKLEAVLENIYKGKFPLFVAEGTSEQKLEKIESSNYLKESLKSLESSKIKTLVTYGFGFNPNDQHIIDAIKKSEVTDVCVGLFGSDINKNNIQRIEKLFKDSGKDFHFYDSASVELW